MSKENLLRTFVVFVLLISSSNLMGQTLSEELLEEIKSEINTHFEHSLVVGEILDLNKIIESVDDSKKAGFIENGIYYQQYNDLMAVFRERIQGIDSQKLSVVNRKITVLGQNSALLTASGTYTAKLNDGRSFSGDFAWTLVYAKVGDDWKIIHTHM